MEKLESKRFSIAAHITLILASVACLVPFILLFVSSVTDEKTLLRDGYSFFPAKFSMEAYDYLLNQWQMITRAYGITIFVTVVGTAVSLLITSMLAYPLSRKDLPGRKILAFVVVFTILFSGGLVPTYIMYTTYFHIKNTIWALIVPRWLMGGFNVLLMRSFFTTSIPPALIESASIDGASEFKIFYKIVMPLSPPIVATVGLMTGLGYWNDWYNGLIYLTNSRLFSLQVVLNDILMNIQNLANSDLGNRVSGDKILPGTSVRMAIATIGVVPVLAAYPFFQKYFVKGITLGAVKG